MNSVSIFTTNNLRRDTELSKISEFFSIEETTNVGSENAIITDLVNRVHIDFEPRRIIFIFQNGADVCSRIVSYINRHFKDGTIGIRTNGVDSNCIFDKIGSIKYHVL